MIGRMSAPPSDPPPGDPGETPPDRPRPADDGHPRPGWRAWVFETIFEHDTKAGAVFDIGLLVAIILSIVVVMLESVDSYERVYGAELRALEWVLTILFTAEYLTRLVCHPRPRVYARSFFGVIDLLAILPTYVAALVPGAQALIVVRMLRFLRIFRVLKLVHFVRQAHELRRALHASVPKIIVFMITVVTLTTISGSIMYLIEGPTHGFDNIPRSVYWAIVTLTTVGYGDISPETPVGQFVSSLIMIMGYGVIAVPTGIVSAELVRSPEEKTISGQCCTRCGCEDHDGDALFCKRCGQGLHPGSPAGSPAGSSAG